MSGTHLYEGHSWAPFNGPVTHPIFGRFWVGSKAQLYFISGRFFLGSVIFGRFCFLIFVLGNVIIISFIC